MDKIYHVLKDLDGRIKSLREESAEHFMDRDTKRFRYCRDVAPGIEIAVEVIKEAYEEHPPEE